MANNKKAAKPAPKSTKTAKPAAKPAKKTATSAPAKKAAKPAAKPVKPAKKEVAPAKKAVKPAAKPAAKPVAKPAGKKVAAKPAAKAAPVKPVKPVATPVKKEAPKPAPQPQPVVPVSTKVVEVRNAPIPKPVPKKPEPVKEVKVPKLSVKTSVPYQPEYQPLEQRQDNLKSNEPLVRYSDADLNEFRELINKKLEAAKKELAYLQGLITRKDEMGGDESENRYMTMEDGSMSMEREQLSQMASRQITYIDHLEKALIRIENKTYGICRVTGKLIDKARLRAVPHATLSLEAKLGLVKHSSEQ